MKRGSNIGPDIRATKCSLEDGEAASACFTCERPLLLIVQRLAPALGIAIAGASVPAAAQPVVTTGDVMWTPYQQNPPSDLGTSDITIGNTGQGSMIVQDSGTVTSVGSGNVGRNDGSLGNVTITGAGSLWDVLSLTIGANGVGTTTVENGGELRAIRQTTYVGEGAGAQGTVTVSGSSSVGRTVALSIGGSGTGFVTIRDGGRLSGSGVATIGRNAGSVGSVTVTGADSRWDIDNDYQLYVGQGGSGTLNISANGNVTSLSAIVGTDAGAQGNVTVTGTAGADLDPTSTWSQSGDLEIGSSGRGTMTIENRGLVLTSGKGTIGANGGSTGVVTATGPTSQWSQRGGLTVGSSGVGTLSIRDGAQVGTSGGTAIIGDAPRSSGTVTVTGLGSLWQIDTREGLTVGNDGQGILTVENGGFLSTNIAAIGGGIGSTSRGSGTVTVTGENSGWRNGALDLTNGALTVADSGTLWADIIRIGYLGNTGTLNINGENGSRGLVVTGGVTTTGVAGYVNFDGGILRASSSGTLLAGVEGLQPLYVNINSGGAFIDTDGYNANVTASLSGDGGLIKEGAGTLTLSGPSSYRGVTQVEEGTLLWGTSTMPGIHGFVQGGQYVTNGGTLDLGSHSVMLMSSLSGDGGSVKLNSGDLVVDQASDTAYAGSIIGSGSLAKLGVGRLTLTGNSTYTGGTFVRDGTLAVNGSIVGDVHVGANGTLAGAGTIGGNVSNEGTIAPGNSIGTVSINGDFAQSASGLLQLDADFERRSIDRLHVGGDATLDGTIVVDAATLLPRVGLDFLVAEGPVAQDVAVQSSLFDYDVSLNGDTLSLTATSARFGDSRYALNRGQREVAGHLQRIWDAGGGSFGALFGTLSSLADDEPSSYVSALSNIGYGAAGAVAATGVTMQQQRLDMLMSCPAFSGGSSMLIEEECAWSQVGGQRLNQRTSDGHPGFEVTDYSLRGGLQREVSPNWFIAFAGGFDRSKFRGDGNASSADGNTLHAGVSLKHQNGPWLLSGALAGSYGWYDSVRQISIPGFEAQAAGDPDIATAGARLRAAYTVALGEHYLRPMIDLDVIYAHAQGYRESGAGILALAVDPASKWGVYGTPAVEIGTRVQLDKATVMRARASAGVSFGSTNDWETSVRLANAPGVLGGFTSAVPLADVSFRFNVGAEVAMDNGLSLQLDYRGSVSNVNSSHAASLRLGYRF